MGKIIVGEGTILHMYGYEFVASQVTWHLHNGVPCARFIAKLTDDPKNDSIRGTAYDGGTYGTTEYTWPEI